jgi:hypothetical protein
MKSSTLHHSVCFCSKTRSPHGHDDEEFNSLLSCSFVLVLQVSQTQDDEEFNSSSSCLFCSSAIIPKDTTMKSSALRRRVIF